MEENVNDVISILSKRYVNVEEYSLIDMKITSLMEIMVMNLIVAILMPIVLILPKDLPLCNSVLLTVILKVKINYQLVN